MKEFPRLCVLVLKRETKEREGRHSVTQVRKVGPGNNLLGASCLMYSICLIFYFFCVFLLVPFTSLVQTNPELEIMELSSLGTALW